MYFFYLLAAIGVGVGVFMVLLDLFKVPSYKTSATMRSAERLYNTKEMKINSVLEELAKWLTKYIHLRDHKRAQIQANLNTARMMISPERFTADCIVKAGVVGCLAIPVLPISPILSVLILVVAVIYYFNLLQELKHRVKAHRDTVEFELVQMIFTIGQVLRNSRDVIQMLQNYREIAGEEMKQELDITLADMLSGNQEQAISRMEIRVGSLMMSDVCRGLISIIRGEDTTAYWISLQLKFTEHQRDLLKRKAEKIPARVNRLSMAMLFAFMGLWLTLFVVQMVNSLGNMFTGM